MVLDLVRLMLDAAVVLIFSLLLTRNLLTICMILNFITAPGEVDFQTNVDELCWNSTGNLPGNWITVNKFRHFIPYFSALPRVEYDEVTWIARLKVTL